jgi:2-polyprenyl-3-methyl-5-hydroxy-6-metoxy-1,4-benzoquinol methylase
MKNKEQANAYKVLSNIEEKYFEEEWYDANAEDHFWFQWRFEVLERLVRNNNIDLSKQIRALDIGCGPGTLITQLEKNYQLTVDGADLNCSALERVSSLRGDTFFYDIKERNIDMRESYDVIFLFDVLEHIEDEKEFLEAAVDHLKPDGLLFINVPAINMLYSIYDKAVGHLRRYDLTMLEELTKGVSVRAINSEYWGWINIPLLLIRKILLSFEHDSKKIVRKGIVPSNKFIDFILRLLMKVELKSTLKMPIGASLIQVYQKYKLI